MTFNPGVPGHKPKPAVLNPDGTLTDYGRNIIDAHGAREINGDLLAASTPRPDRLLLDYTRISTDGWRAEAKSQAKLIAAFGVIPAILVVGFLKEFFGVKEGTLQLIPVMMLAMGIYAYWRFSRSRTPAFEQTKWLDFETRHWRMRRRYVDEKLDLITDSIPFESMAVVCYDDSVETYSSFAVDLRQVSDTGEFSWYGSHCLKSIDNTSDAETAGELAVKVAKLWGVDCWSYCTPYCGGLKRLYQAPPARSSKGRKK